MAQVSRLQILKASEKVEAEYESMSNDLLIMIAKNLKPEGANYALKLNQTEKVNAEAQKIITQHAKKLQKEVSDSLEEVKDIALEDVEPMLQEASEKGAVKQAIPLNDSVALNYLKYVAMTLIMTKFKEVNQTTYMSVSGVYQTAINRVVNEVQAETSAISQLDNDWRFIEEGINDIVVNREITMKAVQHAVEKMTDDGITGYITKSGREWQTDTYSAMVMRTEAHNYAIDCIRERQADYGSDLFQVSAHNGARPLCYPYQSKICSWSSATGGSFIDGSGAKIEYLSLENDTSYGEPAGLFGINCGHYPFPIIPEVSIVHEQPVQPKETNSREYEESQKQRYLEREIRKARRDYEAQRVSGADDDVLKKYSKNIREKQADMRNFIEKTGRTRQYNRESIVSRQEIRKAQELRDKAKDHDNAVTNILKEATKTGNGHLDGLEYRIKGENSLARKLNKKSVDKGITINEYAENVTDILRYTQVSDVETFTEDYFSTTRFLGENGYNMLEVKNTLYKDVSYRGINTLVEAPDGYVFELQFHTPQSLEIKEINHKMYEKQRLLDKNSEEFKRLDLEQIENARKVVMPKNVEDIEDINL